MARRTYGSGSVEKNGKGWRWSTRIGGRRVRSQTYPSKEMAERVLGEVMRQLAGGEALAPAELTLQQWGEIWLSRRTNRAAHNDARRWECHIACSALAKFPLSGLSKVEVKAWLAQLQRKRKLVQKIGGDLERSGGFLSHQTVRHCLNLLRSALRDAVEDGLLSLNVAQGIRLDAAPSTHEPWTHLSLAEIRKVLETAPEPARTAYAVAIYAGARQGELIGLHWGDVDLGSRPQLTLRYSHRGPTKGGRIRRVPLLAPAAAALQAHRDRARPAPEDLVFPAPRGGKRAKGDDFGWADRRRGKQDIDRQTGAAKGPQLGHKSIAGIDRAVRFHDLRHTCASHLIMGSWGPTWTLQEVASVLGHTASKVTERYAHLSPEHLHNKAALTAKCPLIAPSPGDPPPESPTARPAGIEPATHGLEGPMETLEIQALDPDLGTFEGHLLRTAARSLLELAARGQAVPVGLLAMLGVDPDEQHAVRRAIEISKDLLLAAPAVERTSKTR